MHTPRLNGEPFIVATRRPFNELKLKRSAGAVVFLRSFSRPLRTSWLMVGKVRSLLSRNRRRKGSIRVPRRGRQIAHRVGRGAAAPRPATPLLERLRPLAPVLRPPDRLGGLAPVGR